jgi:hypothetical protein
MKRFLFALTLCAVPGPVLAWEFSALSVCTVRHQSETADLVMTYDPGARLYAIEITRREGTWGDATVFGMQFVGAAPNAISTTRQTLSEDGKTLRVQDSGFGNVLNGLEFNARAGAFLGEVGEVFDLTNAAPAIAAFRMCEKAPSV